MERSIHRGGTAESSSAGVTRGVWDSFERGSPAGRLLHKLYSKDPSGKRTGNALSNVNRAEVQRKVDEGRLVPLQHDASKWGKRVASKTDVQVAVPRVCGAAPQEDRFDNPGRVGRGGGKKTEAQIKMENKIADLEIRTARPRPTPELGEKEKNRLARRMEFRGKPPEEQPLGTYKAYQTREQKRATTKPKPLASRLQELERLFTDVNNEIEERRTFLEDMDQAGHKQKYERQIQSEISVRVAQLKRLDVEIQAEEARQAASATM